jgi:hypothetical protein
MNIKKKYLKQLTLISLIFFLLLAKEVVYSEVKRKTKKKLKKNVDHQYQNTPNCVG